MAKGVEEQVAPDTAPKDQTSVEDPEVTSTADSRPEEDTKEAPPQVEQNKQVEQDKQVEAESAAKSDEDQPESNHDLSESSANQPELKERLRERLKQEPVKGRSKAAADPERFDAIADEVAVELKRRDDELVGRVHTEMNIWAERDLTKQLGEFEQRIGALIHQRLDNQPELLPAKESPGTLILREDDSNATALIREELHDMRKSMNTNRIGLGLMLVFLVLILAILLWRPPGAASTAAPAATNANNTNTNTTAAPAAPPVVSKPVIVYDEIPPLPALRDHFGNIPEPTAFLTVLGINDGIFRDELANLCGSVARNRTKLAGPGDTAFIINTMNGAVRGFQQFALQLREDRPIAWIASYASSGEMLPSADRILQLWLQLAMGATRFDGELDDEGRENLNAYVASRINPGALSALADALELGAEASPTNLALVARAFKVEVGTLSAGLSALAIQLKSSRDASSANVPIKGVFAGRALNLEAEFIRDGSDTGLERWSKSSSAGSPADVVLLLWISGNLGLPSSGGEKGIVIESLRGYPRTLAEITAGF